MAEPRLALALIGCGGMGLRHLQGLGELARASLSPFDLVAVCDARAEAAERAATMAEQLLGRRPAVCTDVADLLSGATGAALDAVDLVTDVGAHHTLGLAVLRAGKHLLSEKPLGLTVRACRLLVDAAAQADVVLATAENYRHDPLNRLVKALLEGGAIGQPFMALQESVGGGRAVAITPWRHLKDRGGIVLDMGVHYADLWRYFMGPLRRVGGRVALFEPLRYPAPMGGPMATYYGSPTSLDPVLATAEDTSAGQVVFENGAIGQWLLSLAGHGQGHFLRRFYGSEGSLETPADRTGRGILYAGPHGHPPSSGGAPGQPNTSSGPKVVDDALARALVPHFSLNEPTTRLFGASVLTSYDLPFEVIDRRLLALEMADFGQAILQGRPPEVDGLDGLEAVAAVYAFFESSALGREVTLGEVAGGAVATYQHEIDLALGLA